MDKEALQKALKKEGLFEELDELFNDNVTVKDWVSRHEDLVRSNRAVAQALQVDAPNDVKEGYFKDPDEQRQYDAGEKKYNEERAKRQQLADEYQRAKDIKDFSEFRADKGILGNLAALGMKLTPQAAKNVYIKEGYNPTKLAVHGGLGTMANVAELAPSVGTAGKIITTFAGPTIRAGQDIAEGKSASEVGSNFATDAGLNTLFTYLPLREGYQYVKRVLGKGGIGEKAAKDVVDETLKHADALEQAKAVHDAEQQVMQQVNNFKSRFDKGLVNDIETLKFADDIADEYPELAKSLREHVNALAANRKASNDLWAAEMTNSKDKARREAEDILTERKLPEAKETAQIELYEASKDASDKFYNSKPLIDEEGNLIRPVANIEKKSALLNPSKASKVIADVSPAVRSGAKLYTGSDRKSVAPEDKEYSSAIEYIIQSNKRQWNAGFKPRDGIELEAWQIAKDRGEI